MSSPRHEQAEFFKIVRANVAPVDSKTYHTLYTAIASTVLRSTMKEYYSSKVGSGLTDTRSGTHNILEEQSAQAWLEDGTRLVGASVYTDDSVHKKLFGIEADVAVAPEAGARPDPFELSTDGSLYWVTEPETVRAATPQEMWLLLEGLEAVE